MTPAVIIAICTAIGAVARMIEKRSLRRKGKLND